MKRLLILGLAVMLGSCQMQAGTKPAVQESLHYIVGAPYQLGGVVRYPREAYSVDATGLASVADDHTGQTADGEMFDQTLLAAGHRTLQLPAIVKVTNLENGRQIVLRLNDRGPTSPARMLELTRRSAELLDIHRDGVRIRLQMLDAETRQLAASLQAGPALEIASVPKASIESETLAPPIGATQSQKQRVAASKQVASNTTSTAVPLIERRLPEAVTQVRPNPGSLFIDAGSFSKPDYAYLLVNRLSSLGARLTTNYDAPRDQAYRIRIGPLPTVAAAETMLGRAISAGVNDAAIVVE